MSEKLLIKFKLPQIESLSIVNAIVVMGYKSTGNKFTVAFNGSAGYLSNIEISCEGIQKQNNNRIFVESLRNKDNSLKSIYISVFHSVKTGVRVQVGDNIEPEKNVRPTCKEALKNNSNNDNDDLPF